MPHARDSLSRRNTAPGSPPVRATIAQGIAASIRRQIRDGAYRAGEKLPSIRALMAQLGYSKNSIVDAFELLVSSGEVEPRRGSGYYVSMQAAPAVQDTEPTSVDRALDTVWMLREQLNNDPGHLAIGHGIPPGEWLAENRLERYHHKLSRIGLASAFQYGNRFGYKPLRELLERKLDYMGIQASPQQIVLTGGANQALDIIIRGLLRPGDTALVDEPGYYPVYGKLTLHGVKVVGVPRLPDGPDVAALEKRLAETGARTFFTQSVGQNPTGSDITPAKAHRLLQLAERHDLRIVENDCLADLKPISLARLSTLDQLQRTIYVGSFTKSVAASLRVGFLAASAELADRLADVKMLVQVSTSEYCERLLDTVLRSPQYERHARRLRDRAAQATEESAQLLTRLGAEVFCVPSHSLYLWASFPDIPDSLALARAMLAHRVALAPGVVFGLDAQQTSSWCRYNVGYVCDPRFAQALRSYRRSRPAG
jgi:DNA-binding transcriptional MocR family regulator